ncbi:hypothetical protein [Octadecabacter antarcticus]|uniref:hypothetical protein n=1 Tax=Octadecabacter antarcticus TaxID=1217908 RepID=UPI001651079E|nr:hypothetical protein [Octadecabacter antarcticus]
MSKSSKVFFAVLGFAKSVVRNPLQIFSVHHQTENIPVTVFQDATNIAPMSSAIG